MQKELIDSKLKQEFNNLDFDIKAEAFFVNFIKDFNVQFSFNNYFERGYGKEINDIKTNKYGIGNTHYASLTKLGFYDVFPENIFHIQNNTASSVEMVHQYKVRKKEEVLARNFFQPLENELFQYLLENEQQEAEIIGNLGGDEFLKLLHKIWNIDPNLPPEIMAKVLKFIPFIHKISGNIEAITYLLKHIFNENITLKVTPLYIKDNHNNYNELKLGDNFALKASDITFLKKYIFTFNNIKKLNSITDYFENGKIYKIIALFLKFTLPFESDFEIKFTISQKKQLFVLDDKPYTGRMNISTRLA